MEITLNLDVNDWEYFQSHIESKLSKTSKSYVSSFFVNMIVWAIIAIAILSLFHSSEGIHWPTASSVTVLFVSIFIVLIFNTRKLKKAFAPSKEGAFVGQHQILINDKGITTHGKGYTCTREWSTVKNIEITEKMLFLYLDTAYALVFPLGKLDNPNDFYQFIMDKYNKSLNLTGAKDAPPS